MAPSSPRASSSTARLARLGFIDPERAVRLLGDAALADLAEESGELPEDLLVALSAVADPDLALLSLVRMMGALVQLQAQDVPFGLDPRSGRLRAVLRTGGTARDRLLAVLGASAALGDHLARHPEHWPMLVQEEADVLEPAEDHGELAARQAEVADQMRTELLLAVGADPGAARPSALRVGTEGADALRVAYRRQLLAIAGRDLATSDPMTILPDVARALADLAAAALEAALAVARGELPAGSPDCRLAVIGMGKCGGLELNYVSDVDVVYVVEPLAEDDSADAEARAVTVGARLATGLARVCSESTSEGTLWPVDPNLRPEGRSGPLVRTLASHQAYYRRWAQTWEFQALLKARPVAGDSELGAAYVQALWPMVWEASARPDFVPDTQAMRRRVEQNVPARDADRQLKLGAGGLRDVEFSVQLLQLVHGRTDPRLRTGNTLAGLEALSTYGYVGRDDAAELERAYRMLRSLEHRIQLYRLRRTHLVPREAGDLRRLGRSFGLYVDSAREIETLWRRHAIEVRRLHEKLFYRPLLAAVARLSSDEMRMTPQAAQERLAALGYRDPAGAIRHITAITQGVSRRAAIQRQLLPVMLAWFAEGADPDAGLLAFRRVSETLGTTHWYLKMLRDSGAAAERMAHVLASSRMAAQLLERGPEAVALLGRDADLAPRPLADVLASERRASSRHEDPAGIAQAARAVRRRELERTVIADVLGRLEVEQVGHALSVAAFAALRGALRAALRKVGARDGQVPTRIAVIAMGRLGGMENGYGSDADVLFVHDPVPGADPSRADAGALAVVSELRALLSAAGQEPALEVDAALRPEGRNGPLVRTLTSYEEYYQRWASPWEAQALTRASFAVGDQDVGDRFLELVNRVRWPKGGLAEPAVREIRRIKARVEAERLPRGADPARNLKLGRGSLSDVEWTVQLLQLQHGHEVGGLRTTSTMAALAGAEQAGLVQSHDARVLRMAWTTATRLRNAVVLWSGRPADALPGRLTDLDGVARLAGYPPHGAAEMEEDYQRATRRSRAVVNRLFYGG